VSERSERTQTAQRQPPVVCVGAVVVEDRCLLLVRRARAPAAGRWSIPGGRVERGESLAGAVVRELAEETGLHGRCEGFVGWSELITDEHHAVILDFRVRVGERGTPVAGDDAAEARWVPLGEVERLDLAEGLAPFLRRHQLLEAG
jgi:ADP-ribose pyrophosphatase YjhB (NUDIX family)